jgi:hypothetical protein
MHAVDQIDSVTLFLIVLGLLIFVLIFRAIFRKRK